jgi:hypothetical protein
MTAPNPCVDGADCVITWTMQAMREVFDPQSECPPLGGGSTTVRFFAGEGTPLEAFESFANSGDDSNDCGCDAPFLWVRLLRRYRSSNFPQPVVAANPCPAPRVIAVEIGVGRCAAMIPPGEVDCEMSVYQSEAEISMDDSWRIERALCRAETLIKRAKCSDMVASDVIIPSGPVGGVIAWVGTLYVRLDS